MARPPRHPRAHRPSPLQEVHHARPLSTQLDDDVAMRDAMFWKRFSAAVHASERDEEKGLAGKRSASWTTSGSARARDDWLLKQQRKKRTCRVVAWSVAVSIGLVVAAIAVVAWYYTKGPGKANKGTMSDTSI